MNSFGNITRTQLKEPLFNKEDSANWEQLFSRTVPVKSVDTPNSSILDPLDKTQTIYIAQKYLMEKMNIFFCPI